MPSQDQTPKYLRVADLFKSPRRTSIAVDVRREAVQDRENRIETALSRQQKDWSILANQVVGSEGM